ncbi:MAG: hypothetical protein K1X75_08345 [Leptospirales bacterium]|nr:hypothetical protein [Leptospirales bacterium]
MAPGASRRIVLLATGLPLAALLMDAWILRRSMQSLDRMEQSHIDYIVSSSQFADPSQSAPDAMIDGKTDGDGPDLRSPLHRNGQLCAGRSFAFDLRCSFVQWAGPLSHSAAEPPALDPLRALWIWNAPDQIDGRPARPRRYRLILFRQQITDFDRSHIPPQPALYWTELAGLLPDRSGPIAIDLRQAPPPLPSIAFPENVMRIFARLEIIDFYPGRGARAQRTAIRELAFETERYRPALLKLAAEEQR